MPCGMAESAFPGCLAPPATWVRPRSVRLARTWPGDGYGV